MSTKINRDDWTWLSLFGPKSTNGIPSPEGNFQEDYEVDEEYIEGEPEEVEEEEEEEDGMVEEPEGMIVNYDDDEED